MYHVTMFHNRGFVANLAGMTDGEERLVTNGVMVDLHHLSGQERT